MSDPTWEERLAKREEWFVIDANEGVFPPMWRWQIVNDEFLNPVGEGELALCADLECGQKEDAELMASAPKLREQVAALTAQLSTLQTERAGMVEALEKLTELYALPGESNLDRFERVAQIFHRETGLLAPGKDESYASGDSQSYERRCERWELWYSERANYARDALSASSTNKDEKV